MGDVGKRKFVNFCVTFFSMAFGVTFFVCIPLCVCVRVCVVSLCVPNNTTGNLISMPLCGCLIWPHFYCEYKMYSNITVQ